MDFTKKELETILSCIITTFGWAPSSVSPDFYATLNCIENKCRDRLADYASDSSCSTANMHKKTYHAPEVTTSLKDILQDIHINN